VYFGTRERTRIGERSERRKGKKTGGTELGEEGQKQGEKGERRGRGKKGMGERAFKAARRCSSLVRGCRRTC
jgi:hypothetical protein